MRFRLHTREVLLSDAERARIEGLVREGLLNHATSVAGVEVRFTPSPRIHGDGYTACRIRVRQRDGSHTVAEAHAEHPSEAAFVASGRIEARFDRRRTMRWPLERRELRIARGGGNP